MIVCKFLCTGTCIKKTWEKKQQILAGVVCFRSSGILALGVFFRGSFVVLAAWVDSSPGFVSGLWCLHYLLWLMLSLAGAVCGRLWLVLSMVVFGWCLFCDSGSWFQPFVQLQPCLRLWLTANALPSQNGTLGKIKILIYVHTSVQNNVCNDCFSINLCYVILEPW